MPYLLSAPFWEEAPARLCKRISEAGAHGRRQNHYIADKLILQTAAKGHIVDNIIYYIDNII